MKRGRTVEVHKFFLGGHDLEMQEIVRLLSDQCDASAICDKKLGWGARASDYGLEIAETLKQGLVPVLIELKLDIDLHLHKVIVIDHHNERAGIDVPTSLEQVLELLGIARCDWTRHQVLVAANDRGWIPELRKIGATPSEITEIRAADRKAQGITDAEEQQAVEALKGLEIINDMPLAIVDLPHSRFATVTDRLAQADCTPKILAVRGPNETGIYGPGSVIDAFVIEHPDAWYGGALPEYGFAGVAKSVDEAKLQQLQKFLDA